ncbi:hypothetical protein [Sphingobacterium litopenaei]|uniref:Anti-sigma factor n=1 Tax=Sphingobacterium litopenaei TaxID=2763500 RepID=A0ABR7YDZ9_9SPHI|nr:hypothetical protein [Sphingobacterium litopenaei]MBD1429537.1 hypothetical protein [Sphingobacterium litopenaei]
MENNYQLSRIHNYVHGLMSRDEMHALEREALDDPFLQDAIDGYKLQQGVDVKQLSLLQQRLAERVEVQASERDKRFYSWQRLAIAMASGVLFLTVCTLILMRYLPQQKASALTEVELMDDAAWEYTIQQSDGNNVEPVEGWDNFELYLLQNLHPENKIESSAQISFVVQAGKVSELNISGIDKENKMWLEDIIQNKFNWKGQIANFYIVYNKLNIK